MTRRITTAKEAASNPADERIRLAKAYENVFTGQGSREDADMVMADMLAVTGYFRPPSFAAWMQKTKTPQGFELHCALQAARGEVMRHIMDFLAISDDEMVALEKAARRQSGQ